MKEKNNHELLFFNVMEQAFILFFFCDEQKLAALAQMVACLPLVQQVRGSIPGGVVNFHLKIFN